MWTQVAKLSDCPPGSSLELTVGESIVALFNVDGTLHALDGVCPHQGGPLGKGRLTGCLVTCPWHGWQFDVTTGQHRLNSKYYQPRFAAKVEGDEIWIDLPDSA